MNNALKSNNCKQSGTESREASEREHREHDKALRAGRAQHRGLGNLEVFRRVFRARHPQSSLPRKAQTGFDQLEADKGDSNQSELDKPVRQIFRNCDWSVH